MYIVYMTMTWFCSLQAQNGYKCKLTVKHIFKESVEWYNGIDIVAYIQ